MKRQRISTCLHGFSDVMHCEDCIMTVGSTPSNFNRCEQQLNIVERRRKGGFVEEEKKTASPVHDKYAHRYNGVAPTYSRVGNVLPYTRVPERLYPAPASYGWAFTGSCEHEKAEYYERYSPVGKIFLNFYYTSGTIQVVLKHYMEGEIQLFKKGRSLLPDVYKNVLYDPMNNTDVRFRRRGAQAIQF